MDNDSDDEAGRVTLILQTNFEQQIAGSAIHEDPTRERWKTLRKLRHLSRDSTLEDPTGSSE